jgi:hypothetical protein
VDGARISTKGVVRTGIISNDGAHVVVQNSHVTCRNGVLPADYRATVGTPYMESVPWMLGFDGDVRATNLIGRNSTATYLNSTVFSETWGALWVEGGSGLMLTAVNGHVGNTGAYGYGTYGSRRAPTGTASGTRCRHSTPSCRSDCPPPSSRPCRSATPS